MTHGLLPKTIFILVLAGLLTACGGGGGGGGSIIGGSETDGNTNDTTTTEVPTLTVTLLDTVGDACATPCVINGADTVTVQAVLLDADGAPAAGQIVSFTANSVGQLSPDSGTDITDETGTATVQLGSGTVEGAGSVTAEASVNDVSVTATSPNFQTDGQGDNVGSVNFTVSLVLTTTDGSQVISRGNPGTATVTLTDSNDAADTSSTDGALVEFSLGTTGQLGSSSVFISGNTASVTLYAGTTSGSGQLDATVTVGSESLVAESVTFISEGDSVATVVLTVPGSSSPGPTSSTPVQAPVDNANPVTVTATVTDRLGDLVQGAVVSFTLTGDGRLSRTSYITNVSGIATTTLFAGTTAGFGQMSASTTVDGENVSSGNDNIVTFETDGDEPFTGEGNSNLTIVMGLDTDGDMTDAGEDSIDADNPAVLFATVTQPDGSPSVGTVVQFELGGGIGDLFPANGLALTDSSGLVSVALTAGSVPGASSATATIVISGNTFNSDSLTYSSLGNAGDAAITVTLTFNDATPGNGSNIITTSDPATISILVEDDEGTNLPNRTAIVTTTLGTVSIAGSAAASTATAITDSTGALTVDLVAGATLGTGTLSVAVGDSVAVESFDVGVDGLQIGICSGGTDATDCSAGTTFTSGALDVSTTPLSAGGTSIISLVVVDSAQVVVPNIDIAFTSVCAGKDPAEAEISETVTSNSSGVVTATYLATGCIGIDIITATEASAGLTATSPDNLTDGGLDVLTATIGSIRFDSVSPTDIQIKGTGTSSASVVFQVLDVQGGDVEDASVSFELTTNVGGLSLVSATGLTDSDGFATATVNAGLIPTTVRVRASVDVDGNSDGDTNDAEDFTLETLSDGLSVNTGVPDQNSMSISASELSIEGEGFDGETSSITVRLADAFNNPVPDGTTIQFRTEYGSIVSSCNTVAGNCSVTLQSMEPRRPTDPNTSVQSLYTDTCPTALIVDEAVTIGAITASEGITDYVPNSILRVENAAQAGLTVTTDYTAEANGIKCVSGLCAGALRISYTRLYLDEVGGADGTNSPTSPTITNPGQATTPFEAKTGVPCVGASRAATSDAARYNSGLGQLYGGRSTILAFAQGEESFIDTNGNGQYDFGESFVDLSEAFHDLNEDNVLGNGDPTADDSRNAANPDCYGPQSPLTTIPTPDECYQLGGDEEEFLDFGDNDSTNNLKDLDYLFNAGNGIYNGTLCPDAISARTDTCDNNADPCDEMTERYCTRDLVNIRRDITILFSDSDAFFGVRDSVNGEYISAVDLDGSAPQAGTFGLGNYYASVALTTNDNSAVIAGTPFSIGYGDSDVPPGTGETVSLTYGGGGVLVDIADQFNGRMPTGTSIAVATAAGGCLITNSPGTTVTGSSGFGFSRIFVTLARDATNAGNSGSLTTTVTTPKGIVSARSFTCTN